MDVAMVVENIDAALRAAGDPERAEHERAYLKSELTHYGVRVPAIRAVAMAVSRENPRLSQPDLIDLVRALWAVPVHERRMASVELLINYQGRLTGADLVLLESLLRDSHTWALLDPLAASVIGPLIEREPDLALVLDRWANDPDFWIRRAALLALLGGLRRGDGDFDRFSRYADAMLEEKEFFVRKAIGWVLRETAKKRPDLVYEWLAPRARLASGVTIREAVKPMSEKQRLAIMTIRGAQRIS